MNNNEYVLDGLLGIETMYKQQEQAVFTAIRNGDQKTKARLTQSGMEIVSEIADRCKSSEVGFGELFPEVVAALHEAIHDFDCTAKERFITYLTRCAEERVQKCYNNLSWLLPIDYHVVQLHDRYEMALLELYPKCTNAEDKAVQDEEYVAEYLGVSVDTLRVMKNEYAMCRIRSLDEVVTDDIGEDVSLAETVVDPATENAAAEYLDDLMDCLSAAERYTVCAKNGVLSVRERTDEQIATFLGLDTNGIERLYQGALYKLGKANGKRNVL